MGDKIREALKRMIDAGEFERLAEHIDDYSEAEYLLYLLDDLKAIDIDKVSITALIHMIDSVWIWRALMIEIIAEECI